MTEQEMQETYERLLRLTQAGAIQWRRTAPYEFRVSFPRSSATVGLDEEALANRALKIAFLKIHNDQGIAVYYAAPIKKLASYDFEDPVDFDENVVEFEMDPSELYQAAVENVYKYEKTSSTILEELRRIDVAETVSGR